MKDTDDKDTVHHYVCYHDDTDNNDFSVHQLTDDVYHQLVSSTDDGNFLHHYAFCFFLTDDTCWIVLTYTDYEDLLHHQLTDDTCYQLLIKTDEIDLQYHHI